MRVKIFQINPSRDTEKVRFKDLKDIETVAVTAGASTPTPVTKEVIDFLEAYDPNDSKTWDTTSHITSDKVLFKRK